MTRTASLVALTLALWVSACSGQTDGAGTITVDPVMTKGPADASVTIVEFSDYQCPFCKRAQQALRQVMAEFPGQVRLVFKDFPLDFHERAMPAAVAARCAGETGRYWEYHDLLFGGPPELSRESLLQYAEQVGAGRETFAGCLDGGKFQAEVEKDVREGRALGVTGTPTFFINGQRLVGAHPVETFREVVRDALESARR